MKNFFSTVDRYKVSEFAATHLYEDLMSLGDEEPVVLLDQSKVHRLKKKFRLNQINQFEGRSVTAIGFDERVDKTKKEAGTGVKGSKRFEDKKEEHCVLILWPGQDLADEFEQFAGHVVPNGGKAPVLAKAIYDFLVLRKIDIRTMHSLISDGCLKMVGWKTGVHASLEKLSGRPFQRIICFFHHLELSFQKIFVLYDGPTASPDDWTGPIGKLIKKDVHKQIVTTFVVLPNPSLLALIDAIPEKVFQNLSTDHRVFVKLIRIAITGEVNQQWASMKIGPMVHSRFTNTEVRVVRLYISTPESSFELLKVVRFLVYVWAETFIRSKHYNTFDQVQHN